MKVLQYNAAKPYCILDQKLLSNTHGSVLKITHKCLMLQMVTQSQNQAEEIQQIHSRVKAAVTSKDDTIASLKQQMHSTELMLAQQHAELQSGNS